MEIFHKQFELIGITHLSAQRERRENSRVLKQLRVEITYASSAYFKQHREQENERTHYTRVRTHSRALTRYTSQSERNGKRHKEMQSDAKFCQGINLIYILIKIEIFSFGFLFYALSLSFLSPLSLSLSLSFSTCLPLFYFVRLPFR